MLPKKHPPSAVRAARRMVTQIIEHHFGSPARRITFKPSGRTNLVFEVLHKEGHFVVRLSEDPTRINAYLKEQWAHARVRDEGVPTPEILEVGNEVVPHPYMISRCVRGEEATHHPERLAIARELGALARRIHGVRTRGFGRTFDWSGNTLSRNETWAEYLTHELRAEERIETLARLRMLDAARLRRLRAVVRQLRGWRKPPSLVHADLRLKNVIVDAAGRITALIDWENCESNVAPHWDLAFALHDLGIDAKQEFLEGYGLPWKRMIEMAPAVKAINLLGYAPVLAALAAAGDKPALAGHRARFAGALDLYAL
jgi:hygromycin-B 4-O-kinase